MKTNQVGPLLHSKSTLREKMASPRKRTRGPESEKESLWLETPARLCLLNPPEMITILLHHYAAEASTSRHRGGDFAGEPPFRFSPHLDPTVNRFVHPESALEDLSTMSHTLLLHHGGLAMCPRFVAFTERHVKFPGAQYELLTIIFEEAGVSLPRRVTDWLATLSPEEKTSVRIVNWSGTTFGDQLELAERVLRTWADFSEHRLPSRYLAEFVTLKDSLRGYTDPSCHQYYHAEMDSVDETGVVYRVDLTKASIPRRFRVIVCHGTVEVTSVPVELSEETFHKWLVDDADE
ncbi:ORF18 [Ictalurid herpesvirus 1]|nr:ORF18 [Ictalurid herpesvirus 1]